MRSRTILVGVVACLVAAACAHRVPREVALSQATSGEVRAGEASGGAGDGGLGGEVVTGAGAGAGAQATGGPGRTATGGAGRAAAASTQGVTDTEIRIGFTGPISGFAGEILGEEGVGAIDSYFKMVNAKGGINGRKVKLIAYDNQADFTKDAENTRRLYEQDKVLAVVATLPDAMADYVTRNQIPTLVLGLTASSFSSKFPTVFPILQSNVSATYSFTWGLKDAGVAKPGMKVGITYDTELIDIGPYIEFAKDAWNVVGAEVVTADPFNFSSGDCTAQVLKMQRLQIDWWDFEGLSWVLCVSAAQRLGYRPTIGWGNWPTNIGALAKQAGPWVDGVWFMAPADEPDGRPRQKTAAHEEYVREITRYHPKLGDPVHINSVVTQTYWIVGKVLTAGLTALGRDITKDKLNQWLQGVRNFDTGIAPPLETWDPKCKVGVNTIWIGQWTWNDEYPVRKGRTGYLSNPVAEQKYGKCFVTALADKSVG